MAVNLREFAQLKPSSVEQFSVKGQSQSYVILRFSEGNGPKNFAETVERVKSMKGLEMLTAEEAKGIIENSESKIKFKTKLKSGEWGYIHNQISEACLRAACLVSRDVEKIRVLFVDYSDRDDIPAPVMILKLTSTETEKQAVIGDAVRK